MPSPDPPAPPLPGPRHSFAAQIWAKRRVFRHWVASARRESKVKILFVSSSALLLWLGGYALAVSAFGFVERFGAEMLGRAGDVALVDLVFARLLSSFALAILVLLTVSNALVGFATLYRSRDMPLLLLAPLPIPSLFSARFLEIVWLSSWALAFLGAPLFLAYGVVRDVSPLFYLALVVGSVPFVALPAAVGTALAMIAVRFLAGAAGALRWGLGLGLVIGLFALFRTGGGAPDLSQAETLQAILAAMGRTESELLPSSWLSAALLAAARGDLSGALRGLALLTTTAALLLWLVTLLADRVLYRGWTELAASDRHRSRPSGGRRSVLARLTGRLPEPSASLTLKDLRLFLRDPAQWSQFLLFFGVLALYLANARAPGGFLGEEPWRSRVAVLNMAACLLVLATLTTRFVFPLISLEGRRFWILGLAPLARRQLARQKFLFSLGLSSLFTGTVAVVAGLRLDLTPFALALTLYGVAAATLALSGLAVGLGALFPNFQEDNPARITSGLGGTLNFLMSFGLIVAVVALQAVAIELHRNLVAEPDGRGLTLLMLLLLSLGLLCATVAWLPLRLGMRALERADL